MTKITLLMTPYAHYGYLPFQMASIKAFVESQTNNMKCSCFDLSNRFCTKIGEQIFLDKIIDCLAGHDLNFLLSRQEKWIESVYTDRQKYVHSIHRLRDKDTYKDLDSFQREIKMVRDFQGRLQGRFAGLLKNLVENLMANPGYAIPEELQGIFKSDLDLLEQDKPDLIGFYVFCPTQLPYTLLLAQFLKNNIGHLPVFGLGSFFDKNPVQPLLNACPCLDGIVSGGTEQALADAGWYVPEKEYRKISGLTYKNNGQFNSNDPIYVPDINQLPYPDFNDFPFQEYPFPETVIPLQFSRGCYWNKCAFCARVDDTVDKNHYLMKDIDRCMGEIEYFVNQGVSNFLFIDDSLSVKRLNHLSQMILEKKLDIRFCFAARTEKQFSYSLLKKVHQAGGQAWFIGAESFSQDVIDAMNKGTVVSETVQVLKNAKQAGLFNIVFLIYGFPGLGLQDPEQERKSLSDLVGVIDDLRIFQFGLSTGSPILQEPEKYGLQNVKPGPMFSKHPEIITRGWTYDGQQEVKIGYLNFQESIKKIYSDQRDLIVNGFVDPGHILFLCEFANL